MEGKETLPSQLQVVLPLFPFRPANIDFLSLYHSRRPALVLAACTVVAATVGFRYQASIIRNNEQAQKNSGSPNLYVTVERSGGGI